MKARFRQLFTVLSLVLLVFALNADAGNSFRTQSGRLITIGMSRIELLDLIGEPLSQDTETQGLSLGRYSSGSTIETWSYLISGSIGGKYYLTIILEGGYVIEIFAKQRGRI